MKIVYVLGTGQLGRMLNQAAELLGIKVILLDFNSKIEISSMYNCIITNEVESWPKTDFTNKIEQHSFFINKEIINNISDRFNQKLLIRKLNLKTASWKLLSKKHKWEKIFQIFNKPVIIKTRKGGYDGNGQWIIYPKLINKIPESCYNNKCIIEQYTHFSSEISLIGARNTTGKIVFYPITKTFHKNGILRATISTFKENFKSKQNKAESMLRLIMNKLNYIGVMAMECFVTVNGSLFINELAPRVHNSGHWTQNGASINQFELHLRAILNLPMPKPVILTNYSIMINLIGIKINYLWLKDPLIKLHWYEKEIRDRRKLGHLNLCSNNITMLKNTLNKIIYLLPKEYEDSILWIKKQL